MKRLLLLFLGSLLLVTSAAPVSAATPEYIVVIGGPSLYQWEKYKPEPHDHWWANCVRAGRIRTELLREKYGPGARITWLVYAQGYKDRSVQEKQDLLSHISSVRDALHLNLVYFRDGSEVIEYLNNGQPRDQVKVAFFEYFGHSNRACFMFDYSNKVESACKSWLHESELVRIRKDIFTRDANIRSWGCYTGESMAKKWHVTLGNRMWGAIGKTQYMTDELPVLSSPGGRWTN